MSCSPTLIELFHSETFTYMYKPATLYNIYTIHYIYQARVYFQKLLKFPAIVPTEVTITIIQINEIIKIYQNKKLHNYYIIFPYFLRILVDCTISLYSYNGLF